MKLKRRIDVAFGGFGFGVWRNDYRPNYGIIWSIAIGPFTVYLYFY